MHPWEMRAIGFADRIRDELLDGGVDAQIYSDLMEACSHAIRLHHNRGRQFYFNGFLDKSE
jgi:hypothetical protein